jgi:hypothetical protein
MKERRSKPSRKLRSRQQPRNPIFGRIMEFPQARGRIVERVELITNPDYRCVSIRFKDKTDLSVVIDASLTFNAELSDWKTHDQRVLKRWPPIRSDGI